MGEPAPSFMAKTHKGVYANLNMQPVGSLTQCGDFAVHAASFLLHHASFVVMSDLLLLWVQVLLWFYPKASPGGKNRLVDCITVGRKFEELVERFKAKAVKIVGVSGDEEDGNRKLASDCGLSYPLICDTSGHISAEYGAVEREDAGAEFITKRMSAVLVDRDGKLMQCWPEVDSGFPEECLKTLAPAPPKRPSIVEFTKIK